MKKQRHGQTGKVALLSLSIMTALNFPIYAAEHVQPEEIVVTATRTEQDVKETPAPVEVIDRQKIETLGAGTVVEALKMAFNLNLSEAGMTGNQVSLRGMNTNHSLILIDGRRIAGEDTNMTANAYELNRINLANVERIEIVRGPVSSLYGSDALGGVINIITRKAEKPQHSISLGNSSSQQNASYRFDLGKQGKWSWSLDAALTDVKEQTRSESTNMYGPRQFYNLNGTYELAKNKHLDVFYERTNEELQTDTATTWEDFTNTRNSYGVAFRSKTERANFELRTYYNDLKKDNDMLSRADGSYVDFDRAEYNTWVVDGKNTMRLNEQHTLTYGGEYRTNEYRGTRLGTGGDSPSTISVGGISKPISEKEIRYQAVYLQDEWKLSDKVLVVPSLRYDGSSDFGDNFSPKLGVTYKFMENLRLKTNYGEGFKAPSISELYMNMTRKPIPTMTVIVSGNPDLKPEKSTSFDVSLEGESGANFGKVTYFNNEVTDLISTETSTTGAPPNMISTSKYINVAEAEIKGFEMEAGRYLSDRLTFKTAYAYMDAKDVTGGKRLDGRAQNKYSAQLIYDDKKPAGLSAILWHEWVRDYQYENVNYDYNMLNFTLNKKWSDRYSTFVGVDNILDEKIDELVLNGLIWRFGMNYSF
ncbi:TonB-dependent receptor plug domain-containing protein [Acetonema longum]|uniref:TonB-dependent receptor n=1 Tax=Acetonema longum DSM 6540 TaxID=1009370 RepID=F7NHH5_9FIRM|nr:TonB-dependent receptor [Acetonema longum]EGO64522.1 TonB-dependent receptor [Acetonema longum DSM 6540]